jgi:DNA processing protein
VVGLSDEARFDEARFAAALASLGAGPRRLRMFLDGYAPDEAWGALSAGKHRDDPDGVYRDKASPALLDRVTAACARGEAAVRVLGSPGYPEALSGDPQAPAVLFTLGDPARLDRRPLVAIVGTRSATTYGLGIASEIGRGLAEAGVGVVSGLAQGIDAAAHAGAVAAADDGGPPAAVLGAALDAPVPPARRSLLDAVARRGAVLSELPPGTRGAPGWWFAVRNRVMAAMAHVVVVVESHLTGGSWYTVTAAAARGVTVAAVPGSVRSPASAGTNRLLVEGAVPVRDVDDVLTALELAVAGRPDIVRPTTRTRPARLTRHTPSAVIGPVAKRVRRALDHDPAPLDVVVRRTGLALGEVALALEQLAEAGLAHAAQGYWSRSG